MTTLAPPDPLLLAARHAVAAALADTLRAPAGVPERSDWIGVAPRAWALIRAAHDGLTRADLGLDEELPAAVDASHVDDWLVLSADLRRGALQAVFGLTVGRDCPPFETEYCRSRDPFHRAQHMADLCGFFRAFGVAPDPHAPERPDHISNHVSFIALLLAKAAVALDEPPGPPRDEHLQVCGEAHRTFIADHAAEWIPTFACALHRRAAESAANSDALRPALHALAGVAHLLRAWIAVERIRAGVPPARRLPQPRVAPPDPDADQCGSAETCDWCDRVQ